MGAQRGAVFETYLPLTASDKTISAVLDKLRAVCDRQEAIGNIRELESKLKSDQAALAALGADMERVKNTQIDAWQKSGRKGPFKLSQAEEQHRQNLEGSVINRQKSIEFIEAELERYRSLVG